MTRVRSPNFPAISLGEAIQKVRKVWEKEQKIAAPKNVIARHLGYNGLNGKSLKIISALYKYGLLDEIGEKKFAVSDLAMRILFQRSDADKQDALAEAAFKPTLFAQFREEWGEGCPSDETFASYLLHKNFAISAVEKVIRADKDTLILLAPDEMQNPTNSDLGGESVGAPCLVYGSRGSEGLRNFASAGRTLENAAAATPQKGSPFSINIVETGLKISADIRDRKTLSRMIELLRAYEPFLNESQPDRNAHGACLD